MAVDRILSHFVKMSSLLVLFVCCCYFVAIHADHNDTIFTLEALLHKTNKNIQEMEQEFEAQKKEVEAVKKSCSVEIGKLNLVENDENAELKKEIDILKSLKAEFIVIESEEIHTKRLITTEKNNLKKIKFELTLMLGYTQFLKERRHSNKAAICSELMNTKSELSTRHGEATIIILHNELNLANNKLEQLKNRIKEHNMGMREIKELCNKGIKDLKEEAACVIVDINKAKESIQKLKALREVKNAKLKTIIKGLDDVVKLEKALNGQFESESLALKRFESDEACYKALHNDVVRQFRIYNG